MKNILKTNLKVKIQKNCADILDLAIQGNLVLLKCKSRNAWKFLEKSAALSMNTEWKDMSSLCDKQMLILKGRFHHFKLSNRHFKGIQNYLRTFSFHFEVLKGVF